MNIPLKKIQTNHRNQVFFLLESILFFDCFHNIVKVD